MNTIDKKGRKQTKRLQKQLGIQESATSFALDPINAKALHKIERLDKKCKALRAKSVAANKKVKDLAAELYWLTLRIKKLDYWRERANDYQTKYCNLIKDIDASQAKDEDFFPGKRKYD